MENLEVILSLIVTIVGFLTSTVALLVKYIKSISAKHAVEHQVQITDALLKLIIEAEQFVQYSGEEKRAYVIEKAQGYARDHNLTCDVQLLTQKLEEIIALTKQVNTKK